MARPLLLDLFCGAGGAAVGYHRAGFDVVGVDIKPQPRYPFRFIQADALRVLDDLLRAHVVVTSLDTYYREDFSAIHASPPCQAYIQRNKNLETKHPKLIAPTRDRLKEIGVPFVIENVLREVLVEPVMLCGTFFGLPLIRHRYFEASPPLLMSTPCHHWGTVAHGQFAAVYGMVGKGPQHGLGVREAGPHPGAPAWGEAMGIDWMETKLEIRESIPPAYTEFIGKHLMALLLEESKIAHTTDAKGPVAANDEP